MSPQNVTRTSLVEELHPPQTQKLLKLKRPKMPGRVTSGGAVYAQGHDAQGRLSAEQGNVIKLRLIDMRDFHSHIRYLAYISVRFTIIIEFHCPNTVNIFAQHQAQHDTSMMLATLAIPIY
jgi:hypothetical protein